MVCFDFAGLLRVLKCKGYELILYPNYALCNIVLGLMERLDSRAQSFRRYTESVGDQDEK